MPVFHIMSSEVEPANLLLVEGPPVGSGFFAALDDGHNFTVHDSTPYLESALSPLMRLVVAEVTVPVVVAIVSEEQSRIS